MKWITFALLIATASTGSAQVIEYVSHKTPLQSPTGGETAGYMQFGFHVDTDTPHDYPISNFWLDAPSLPEFEVLATSGILFSTPRDLMYDIEICCFAIEGDGFKYSLQAHRSDLWYSALTPDEMDNPATALHKTSGNEMWFMTGSNPATDIEYYAAGWQLNEPTVVPEPATLGLLAGGLALLGLRRRII